jgi:hypothetical protein
VEQWEILESKGTAHGKHFSLQLLIRVLQVYLDKVNKVYYEYNYEALNYWCKMVGGAQKQLPAHVVNEYCRSDRPFNPCPQEWESKLPRTRKTYGYSSSPPGSKKGTWFIPSSSEDGLGLNFAFYRSASEYARAEGDVVSMDSGWAQAHDIKALQSLWKTRTKQLELLRSQLSSTTNQYQGLKTELKELKYETSIQTPKLTPPVSQIISQTILPPPTLKTSFEQLVLQDQLIVACEQGDTKAVDALLKLGAKPDMADIEGKQPLGAAIWGMCPDVVNTLLKQAGNLAPMTWDECEKHNQKH